MRAEPLPLIFGAYTVRFSQRASASEWCSECPTCGGDVHPNSEWPDRCRWFLREKPHGWCRRCGTLFWPDASNQRNTASAEDIERWRQEQETYELARKRSAELALAHLRDSKLWIRYHEQMDGRGRTWWRDKGIPNEWQDFWRLGWNRHWTVKLRDGRLWDTPTATIPLFDHSADVLNVKHRLVKPPDVSGKYRYQVAGQPHPLFLTNPEVPLAGHAIAVEGEIKAAVTYIALDDSSTCVVGLPGAMPGQHVVDALAACERVTLVIDPGAEEQGRRLAHAVGQQARLLVLPGKVDDVILTTGAKAVTVRAWLRQAERVKWHSDGC